MLPGGVDARRPFEIEKRKLRGEVSDGMILSERELELGQDHGGIMLLDDALEPGTPLGDVLPIGDDVLEIETGYNRPDLTSVYGIAREVAALTGATLSPVPGTEPEAGRGRVGRHPDRGSRAVPRATSAGSSTTSPWATRRRG